MYMFNYLGIFVGNKITLIRAIRSLAEARNRRLSLKAAKLLSEKLLGYGIELSLSLIVEAVDEVLYYTPTYHELMGVSESDWIWLSECYRYVHARTEQGTLTFRPVRDGMEHGWYERVPTP